MRDVTKPLSSPLVLPPVGIVELSISGAEVIGLLVVVGGGKDVVVCSPANAPSSPPDRTGGGVGITIGVTSPPGKLGVKVIPPPSIKVGITIGPTPPPEILGVKAKSLPSEGMVGSTTGPTSPPEIIEGREVASPPRMSPSKPFTSIPPVPPSTEDPPMSRQTS